jgi:hypothetical protein
MRAASSNSAEGISIGEDFSHDRVYRTLQANSVAAIYTYPTADRRDLSRTETKAWPFLLRLQSCFCEPYPTYTRSAAAFDARVIPEINLKVSVIYGELCVYPGRASALANS